MSDTILIAAAIAEVRSWYPLKAFPENGESEDCKSASVARHTCDNIYRIVADALAAAHVPSGLVVRLWDSQWVNVVNHDYGYRDWKMEDAISHAVKMTEDYIAANVREGKLPPPRPIAAAQGEGK